MRKIILIIALFVLSVGVHSCSLDKTTKTAPTEIKTPGELTGVRNGIYGNARGAFIGSLVMHYDYMSDMLNETRGSGNRGHFFYNWELESSTADVGSIWATAYSLISRANLIIDQVDGIIVNYPADEAKMKVYKGEALLWRAIMHRYLALRFSVDYEPGTASTKFGIPYMDEFGYTLRTARGTLQYTYDRILEDVLSAEALLTTPGKANAHFLTEDCVTAFKAQVYVDMHKYPEAIAEVNKLIAKYPLATNFTSIENIWLTDLSTETIFHVALTKDELSQSLSYSDYYSGYLNISNNVDYIFAGYVPSQNAVDLYKPGDLRTGLYVNQAGAVIQNRLIAANLLSKYRGNASFKAAVDGNYNCQNSAKVFRIADMILLKAEAEYVGGTGTPAATLNLLRASRGLPATTTTGAALFTEIQNERSRELIGEGNRLPDIKRWKLTVNRVPQTMIGVGPLHALGKHTMNIAHDADKILLPIPLTEFTSNPNLKGQQNPGYSE